MYVVQNFELLRHASWGLGLVLCITCVMYHMCGHSLMMFMVTLTPYMEAVITLLLFTIG